MALNRFNIWVVLQIFLIAGVGMLIAISIQKEYMLMTTAGLIILWLGQILFLNFFVNRIHRDVHKFLEALKNQDTSQLFMRQKQGRYFRKLYTSFNEITRNFRLVRIEKEVESLFIKETVKQAASGIVAVTETGSIKLINKAALLLLGMEELSSLSGLGKTHPELAEILGSKEPVAHPQLSIGSGGKMIQLAVKSTEISLEGNPVWVFSLLDISREMARSEVEAWQKLIRVLNHEITNSVSPIHILASSLYELLHEGSKQKSLDQLDEQTLDRLVLGLRTMIKRSEGLTAFLNTYKSFTKPGEPVFSRVRLSSLFDHIRTLLAAETGKSGVELKLELSPAGLQIRADEKLMEQTLINLVKNAIHALEGCDHPVIHLKAYQLDEHVNIEVKDNGRGISEEIIEHIFTPFFTTRKEGSGIGLSLARQIMQMHNASIHVSSVEGVQTTFTLTF